MVDTLLAAVGIVVKEPWADDISYEMLNYTLWKVQDGGDGCGYVALKDNIGVRPDSDTTVWRKAVEAGQSIYDLAVKYGHFDGTEEEFEAQYQAVLQAARDAASATNATNEEIQSAEELRVTAEQGRVSAENSRVGAEESRASAELTRENNEQARRNNESGRSVAEQSRATAEQNRVSAENSRVSAENNRANAEVDRRNTFEALEEDMETAIGQADAATAAASEINNQIVSAENSRVSAENGRVTAEGDRVTAEQERATAETSRATAENSRVTAEESRASAETSRATAETNRETRANTDHNTATSDHETAASDHNTAASDHTQAASDHTTAAEDHTQAVADHAVMAGYDTRLGNVEDEVSQLGQEVDGLDKICKDISAHSKNLADFAYRALGQFVNSTGVITANASACSIIFPVQKNTTYTISRTPGFYFRAACFTSYPEIGSQGTNIVSRPNQRSLTITTGADTEYIFVYLYYGTESDFSTLLGTLQIEVGSTRTEYVAPGYSAVDGIARDGITGIYKNLSLDLEIEMGALSSSPGLIGLPIDSTTRARTKDFIYAPFTIVCNPGFMVYYLFAYDLDADDTTVGTSATVISAKQVYAADASKKYKISISKDDTSSVILPEELSEIVSFHQWGDIERTINKEIGQSLSDDVHKYPSSHTAKAYSDDKLIKFKWMGASGPTLATGEYAYRTDTKKIRKNIGNLDVVNVPFYDGAIYQYGEKLYVWDGSDMLPITGQIEQAADAYIAGTPSSFITDYSTLISNYDALVSSYPEFVTKQSLGLTEQGTNIWEYIIKTPNYNNAGIRGTRDSEIDKPIFAIMAGVHGYERSAVNSLYLLVRDIITCNGYLGEVLGNTELHIIPCVCPWGFDNESRVNANGVNINRNFNANWVESGVGTNDYSGPSAASEMETQIAQSWIDSMVTAGAKFIIDWHNSGYVNEISCLVSYSNSVTGTGGWKNRFLVSAEKLTPILVSVFNVPQDDIFAYTSKDTGNGMSSAYIGLVKQVIGGYLETSWNVDGNGPNTPISAAAGATLVGNVLKHYAEHYSKLIEELNP